MAMVETTAWTRILRASPPDVEASGKNDSTVWWVWFITKEDQRQGAGGGAKLVKS